MHSMILDHYTQCPFDNSFHHYRKNSRPHRTSIANVDTHVDTPPDESVQPAMSSLPGQSVLTWSPTQVLMASPLVSWTPYLATVATSPTAKYSLDLQLSLARSDSGLGDTSPAKSPQNDHQKILAACTEPERSNIKSVPGLEDDTTSDEEVMVLPSVSNGENSTSDQSIKEAILPSIRSKSSQPLAHAKPVQSNLSTTIPSNNARKRTSWNASSKLTSSSDQGTTLGRSESFVGPGDRAASLSSSSDKPRHRRLSIRSDDSPIPSSSTPLSARRSSTFPTNRTTSRTDSFILSRNEPRPIDFVNIVHRTREQHGLEAKATAAAREEANAEDEEDSDHLPTPSDPPEPQNHRDHPIDWTSPNSRAEQYAAIDRKKKGVKGLLRRVRRRLKLGKMEMDFYEGGSDVGSVRRYRICADHS